jgi:hypothetical protein
VELDVLDPGLLGVLACEGEHLVGHVEAVRPARRTDAPGGEQHVDAAARSEVEHRLALVQFGDGRRIAAAERGEGRGVGQLLAVAERVERGAEDLAAPVERLARGAASGAGIAARDLGGGGGVALADLLAHVRCAPDLLAHVRGTTGIGGCLGGGQLSHADSSFSASGIT